MTLTRGESHRARDHATNQSVSCGTGGVVVGMKEHHRPFFERSAAETDETNRDGYEFVFDERFMAPLAGEVHRLSPNAVLETGTQEGRGAWRAYRKQTHFSREKSGVEGSGRTSM
jgi:hypothetical protein